MDVEAGVTKLGDLLGQELHSLGGVAEDDGLIYLQLQHILATSLRNGDC